MKKTYISWKYKQELLITNPSGTEGFQGTFVLHWKPGMAKDFRDIRFSSLLRDEINYHIEPSSIINFKSCRVWLALPANITKLYMYYGNGGAKSASNGPLVFEFIDAFTSGLNTSTWIKVHGTSSVTNGILTLESTTLNTILQSKRTFGVGYLVEARAYHAKTNRSIIGFRDSDTEKAAAWHGPVLGDSNYYDYRFTHNGSSGTWTSDGVSRSSYCIYGVAHLTAGPKFYVNYSLRGTASSTLPGSVSLPINFYSEYNKGPVKVDWVRVRKYADVEPTITIGRKFSNQTKGYPWKNTETAHTSIGMTANIMIQHRIHISSQIGMYGQRMFRYPEYYYLDNPSPYPRWKSKGDIRVPSTTVGKIVNIIIPLVPGMTLDCRDLRFAYKNTKLKYYLEYIFQGSILTTLEGDYLTTSEGDILTTYDNEKYVSVWVSVPANVTKINYYYGNGIAVSKSDETIYSSANLTDAPIETVERHRPQQNTTIPHYDSITAGSFMGMQAGEMTSKERKELRDYSLISCDVSKSTDDTYIQLSANFADLTVPPEKSTVKYIARDTEGNQYILFHGKVVANTPTLGYAGSNLKMQAADRSRNLAVQKVPWNYQTIGGNGESWYKIINTLIDGEQTGVQAKNIINVDTIPNQFVFDPKTSRLEAIQKIADEMGSIINIKLISKVVSGITVTQPYFYLVPPESIDEIANGFDLPSPITFSITGDRPQDQVVIPSDPEEKYNKVIVYGVLSGTGETVVAAAYSPAVYLGAEKPREYIVEDNSLVEKSSTAEREAIKWLLYFTSPRATVSAKFINRFDFELYQRVKFGSGFSPALQALTNSVQLPYVVAFDPRDEANSTHIIDVSGVPTPKWLRVTGIKYHSENIKETCELTLTTDYIYSKTDPIILLPYSDYLSPGYRKPSITDPVTTTEAIVNGTISKQLQPETCTVLSINTDNKTAVVQTSSGKLVTIQLP